MFSIIIPIYNEAENIPLLLNEIFISLTNYNNYEIILIDDCSKDNTSEVLIKYNNINNIKIIKNNSNKGQSFPIHNGIKKSNNKIIVTIDGDCQNNPADIPNLVDLFSSDEKIKLNITAIFTKKQIKGVINSLNNKTPAVISIFCGRIADAGVNPSDFIQYANKIRKNKTNIKILWASTREIYNIIEAQNAKSDIITVPTSILNKLNLIGKNLDNYSVETVRMFYDDAKKAGYKL